MLLEAISRRGRSGLDGLIECLKVEDAYKALVVEIGKGIHVRMCLPVGWTTSVNGGLV